MTVYAFGKDGAITIQRLIDNTPSRYNKINDNLASLIRNYAIRNRRAIPEGIEAFREYQLAIVSYLHGISPEVKSYTEKLLNEWR